MADIALLKLRLAQAQEAYHKLAMGESVVELTDQNGERIKYNQTSLTQLAKYIALLKTEIGAADGSATSGPMRVYL